MADQQPGALWLADALAAWEWSSDGRYGKAAAELRRLHALNTELLAALRTAADHLEGMPDPEDVAACVAKVRAAIAKAEGK
jgi:hypothetical protein